MAPLPQWQPRRTLIDLYTERDRTRWYWRLLGMLSASMILVGFLVFPTSFETTSNIQTSQGGLSIVALILLALGYSLSVALWFICQSLLFQLDVLFVPCLFSCVLGLLNTGISLGVHPATQAQWNTSSISATALALASTIIYSSLSIYTFRKIYIIRSRDAMHRRADGESIDLLPEDEQQRQQLLRLLLQKENAKKPSPAGEQRTFWIDLPDSLTHGRESKQATSFLTTPSNIHEGRGRVPGSMQLEEQFAQIRGRVQEIPLDRHQEALARARERSRETSRTPPVIVNTRSPQDIREIPLSERHPLEREDFIRGARLKETQYQPEGVYRHDEEEHSSYDSSAYDPTGEGRRAESDLEQADRARRQVGVGNSQRLQELEGRGQGMEVQRGELEAEAVSRIVRVQTDGWPGR